jgi:hypothetical protein
LSPGRPPYRDGHKGLLGLPTKCVLRCDGRVAIHRFGGVAVRDVSREGKHLGVVRDLRLGARFSNRPSWRALRMVD